MAILEKARYRATACALASFLLLFVLPVVSAAQNKQENPEVSQLLQEARDKAAAGRAPMPDYRDRDERIGNMVCILQRLRSKCARLVNSFKTAGHCSTDSDFCLIFRESSALRGVHRPFWRSRHGESNDCVRAGDVLHIGKSHCLLQR